MVLPDPSESMPPQENDPDPYANNDLSQWRDPVPLPQPIPVVGWLLGYNRHYALETSIEAIVQAQTMIKRPLTQDEKQAMFFWQAKKIQIKSYSAALGIAGGLWRAYDTRAEFRFPFFRPRQVMEVFSEEFFPHLYMPLLRGNKAVLAWHGLRTLLYCTAGVAISKLFATSYAMGVSAVGMASDPRMAQLKEDMRARREKMKVQHKGPQPARREQAQKQDDASPAGGIYSEEDFNKGGPEMVSDDPNPPKEQTTWKPIPPPVSRQTRATTSEAEKKSSLDYFDDASPTNGQGMSEDTEPSQPPGSAWERIRRREGAQRQGGLQGGWNKQRSQAQEGGSSDDFTSTQLNEERRYSKQDAQKEFDARVEKERQGGDFSSNKKW